MFAFLEACYRNWVFPRLSPELGSLLRRQIARRQGYCLQECDEEDIVDIVPFVGVRIANIPS